jgi:hypothetical protein
VSDPYGGCMRWIVLVVLLMLLAVGCLGSSGSPSPPSSSSPVGLGDWHLHRVEVTGVRVRSISATYPYSLAAGYGQIWVAETLGVGRIDAAARRVRLVARIPNSAEWYDIAYEGGTVWYLAPSGRVGVVYRVDAKTGRLEARQRFDGGPLRERTQTWHDIAPTTGGVCVGRLAGRSRDAVLCSAADLRRGWWLRGGPTPVVAGRGDTVWIGGVSLIEADVSRRHASQVRLTADEHVTAIAPGGQGAWVAVNGDHGRSPSELWYVEGHRVLKRLKTTATDIDEIAWSGDGLWATTFDHRRIALCAVEPTGKLKRIALLPGDARSLTATHGAVWTADYREHEVSQISYRVR